MSETTTTPAATTATNGEAVTNPIIQVEASDASVTREAAGRVQAALMFLGELRAKYLREEAEHLHQLEQARVEFETTVRTLARKYVRDGRYNFNAELGAFIPAPKGDL